MFSPWTAAVPLRHRIGFLSVAFWRDFLVVGLLVTVAGAHATSLSTYAFEDAYITFRYAQNLAEGKGFVFNPGDQVLGTSTPLLTLLLALLGRLGCDIPSLGTWIYSISLSLSGFLGAWFLRRRGLPWAGAVFALITVWGTGRASTYLGMETTLHLALILACLVSADRGSRLGTGILLGLLCLNRYDGTVVAVVVGLYLWRARGRPPWMEAFVAVALFGAWLAFAQIYFGSIFPNTLGAKAGDTGFWSYVAHVVFWMSRVVWSPWGELGAQVSQGIRTASMTVLLLPLLALIPMIGRQVYDRALWMPFGVSLILTAGYGMIGPPHGHMWYHLPGLYTLILTLCGLWGRLAGLVLDRLVSPERSRVRGGLAMAGLLLPLATMVLLPRALEARTEWYLKNRNQEKIDAYRAFSRFIVEHDLQETSLLTREPGFMTYHTGQDAIDAAGLVSRGIYFHGPRERRTGLYDLIQGRRPDFVSVPVKGRRAYRVLPGYVPVVTGPSSQWLFMRRETYEARFEDLWRSRAFPGAAAVPGEPLGAPVFDRWTRRGRVGSEEGVGFAWSPDFEIDFDELVLEIGADSTATRMELVVDDLVVFELSGEDVGPGLQRRGVPVYPWKGRRGRLRIVDEDSTGGIRVESIVPRSFGEVDELDGFDGVSMADLWPEPWSSQPQSSADLGRRHGIHLVQSPGLASSLGRSGAVQMISRPFLVENDFLLMAFYDFGDARCGVHLWVDGRRVLSRVGRGTKRLQWLKWDLRPYRGRMVALQLRDGNEAPEIGLAVDSIVTVDP